MIKKSNQKLKLNKNSIMSKNNKSSNTCVGVAYYATQNAITLIALVITIIVLLILAGVTINLVLGPEGLLKQAQDATDKYKQAENQELNSMSNLLAQLENINNGNGGGTPSEPDNPGKPVAPSTAKPGDIIKVENNIKYTSDGEGNVIPVPEGFTYTGEGTKETGFVIKNDVDNNEFVWVPVEDMPYTYDRYAFVGGDMNEVVDGIDEATGSSKIKGGSSSFYYTEALKDEEKKSVGAYGGYYIARYEAGILTQRTSHTTPTEKPVFRKSEDILVYVYDYVTINEAKELAEGLYTKTENNVISKLCSSYAWDTVLKFIEINNPEWITNSVGGNYYTGPDEGTNYHTTGYHSINNIFDLGGNVWEWTTEYCSYVFGSIKMPYTKRRWLFWKRGLGRSSGL